MLREHRVYATGACGCMLREHVGLCYGSIRQHSGLHVLNVALCMEQTFY